MDGNELKHAIKHCAENYCIGCMYRDDIQCVNHIMSAADSYIADLEERIAIMQESMETLEKRNEPIKPIVKKEQDYVDSCLYDIRYCSKCKNRLGRLKKNFCCECGQAVKWE